MNNKDIGNRIKKLREANNLTQAKLAKDIGYRSNAVISKLENGESELTASQIKKITDYFKISSDYLLKGVSNKEESKEKSLQVTKSVKAKKKLSFIQNKDYVFFALILIVTIIIAISNDEFRKNTIVVFMIINISFFIYLIINKVLRFEKNTININIPLNKEIKYHTTYNSDVRKKYKKNIVISGIVMILTNILFYGIIITTISEQFSITPTFLVIALFLIVTFKSIIFIISRKLVELDITFMLLVVLAIELVITNYYLLYLDLNDVLTSELVLVAGFNYLVFLVIIMTIDIYLGKYNYKIE